jgi:hypothetical protein
VFDDNLLRIFGSKKNEVTGDWRKQQIEDIHSLHSSPNIVRVIKSRMMRWAGHVALMGDTRNAYKMLFEKPEVKRSSEDLGVNGMITLKGILGK